MREKEPFLRHEQPLPKEAKGGFDVEKEKEKRKEIRKMLARSISEAVGEAGFKKEGNSIWTRRAHNRIQIVYLQRSMFSHSYYIEAGICEDADVPEGKKPDIVYCKGDNRKRVEYIAPEMFLENSHVKNQEEVREISKKAEELQKKVLSSLNFEAPDEGKKYKDEYFVPSVSNEEAQQKIEAAAVFLKEYVPQWLEKHSH